MSGGRVEARGADADLIRRRADECRSYLPFCEELEDIFNEDDPATRADYAQRHVVVRATTPPALTSLGLLDRPMVCTEHHLWMIMAPDEAPDARMAPRRPPSPKRGPVTRARPSSR